MNTESIKIELKVQLDNFFKKMIEFIDNQPTSLKEFKVSKPLIVKTEYVGPGYEIRSLTPTQPEGYQGLNKWYVSNHGHIFYAVENSFVMNKLILGYGLNSRYNEWSDKITVLNIHVKRLATESEIIEAIKKGLEQKGIVEGARVRCLSNYFPKMGVIEVLDIQYDPNCNDAWIFCKDCNIKVFDNGTFAEVVKEEKGFDISKQIPVIVTANKMFGGVKEEKLSNCKCKSVREYQDCSINCDRVEARPTNKELLKETELQEYKKTHQLVNPLKDSSNKELLKNCLDLINYYQNQYYNNNSKEANVQTQYLLTKLNKHLNHD